MRGFWGRYELCEHDSGDEQCDGAAVHWALLEVEYEHVPSQPQMVRIVKPDIGLVEAIDVRATADEARRRLSDNLRYLAVELEKQMNEAQYASRRLLEGPVEAMRLNQGS
jgi:hypothetical protein